MATYSARDLTLVPNIDFSFVEGYIKEVKKSSGSKTVDRGFKYFSESYVHELSEKQPIEAMFQGSQYLTYDLTYRSDPFIGNKDKVSLHFKTTQADGLLFYTGEGQDYMTIFLKNGDVYVAIDLGSGEFSKMADMNGYDLDDGQWHQVEVTRISRMINVNVDGQQRTTGSTLGTFTMLSSSILYVGGSQNTQGLKGSQVRANFKGCMKQVEYVTDNIDLDLIEMAQQDHNLISNINVIFGQCEKVRDSQPVTFTTPEAFIALPRWDIQAKRFGTIEFQFRTTEPDGLLIYNSGKFGSNNYDFVAMEIIDGDFYLVMDLGSGAIKEKVSKMNVDDGMPHIVYFEYNGRNGLIRVDNHEIEYTTPGSGKQLDLEDMFFIGGMDFQRYNTYRLPKELWAGVLQNGFVGCIQDLVINNDKIDLMTVARKQYQRDIRAECRRGESQCASQPCFHHGACTEGWNRYICDCRNTSYRGKNCEYAATTLTFDTAQFVLVTLPEETYTESEDISLRFRTARASGLLLMTKSSVSADAIELFLERGACKLTFSLGPKSKTLSIGHNLNDEQWHTVFIKRRGQKVEFWVDPSSPVTATITQFPTTMRVKQIVLGSVGPLLSGAPAEGFNGIQNDAPIQEHPWFVGDMQQLVYNRNHYFDVAQDENAENIQVTARFDSGDSVAKDAVTFQSQETYVALPHQLLKSHSKHFSMSFKFKTSQASGLIMYCGKGPDFLALELADGFMYYIYDMGGGPKRIQVNTPEPLNDNKWHDLSLFRPETDQQQIRLDNNPSTVEDMKGYSGRQFNLKGELYVGGFSKSAIYTLSMKMISSRNGFLGCIASLDMNGERINILEAAEYIKSTEEHSVTQGCSGSEVTCHAGSCDNGGICRKQWNSYICDCDMTTFTGPRCTQESVTYQIGLDKGLIVFEYPQEERPSTKSDYLAIGITTNLNRRATILRIDSADTDDFIEMELVDGNIFMVYNLGQEPIPIVTLDQKVNDGKYHRVMFVRNEANAILQVDLEKQTKNPAGRKMTAFNEQARVMLGGRKDSTGAVSEGFQGTVSGFVFNGMRILDLLKEGDPRVRTEGDIILIENEESSIAPPERVKYPDNTDNKEDVQSTQGMKVSVRKRSTDMMESFIKFKKWKKHLARQRKIDKRFNRLNRKKKLKIDRQKKENSSRRRKKNSAGDTSKTKIKSNLKPSQLYFQLPNLIQSGLKMPEFKEIGNEIVQGKLSNKTDQLPVINNTAQKSHDHSNNKFSLSIGQPLTNRQTSENLKDYVIGGNIDTKYSPRNPFDVDNDDTHLESSGHSSYGHDMLQMVPAEAMALQDKREETVRTHWRRLISHRNDFSKHHKDDKARVTVEEVPIPAMAIDRTFTHNSYPKDRGKQALSKIHNGRRKHSSSKHSKGFTPRQENNDDIIFSSGSGPDDCYSDDEDDCIPTDGDMEDNIITPTIVITRISTPKPDKKGGTGDDGKYEPTPIGTELLPESYNNTTKYHPNKGHDGESTHNPGPKIDKNRDSGGGHLNIFLFIGIGAGVLVALIILAVALYKFRSREEGSYRVDESQNFAYLEAKKQQTNGSAVNNVGNGKTTGKKRDVKEWYV